MQREKPSSCQVPLALAILILVAAALFCFVGALALGIGAYYFIAAESDHSAAESPTPEATPTPEVRHTPETQRTPVSPAATPTVSSTPFTVPSPSATPFRSTTPSTPPAPSTRSAELDEYGFHTAQIQIGNETLDVELAETTQQLAKGLRFRETLAENAGMLFIFPKPQRLSFWMKDATIPLSIAYIQPDGKIVQIRKMQPYDETPVPSLSDGVSYALLVNQGWFERHGISAGTVIEDLPPK
ncbi:MAG TPA: DUF192 domain-containing protein [Chthoniobacterales bacterium]|nr:DUF192 domain-containing protein [Chthoniobacterales bacterium]